MGNLSAVFSFLIRNQLANMKFSILFTLFAVFAAFQVSGQHYESIYAVAPVEIQDRIDQNKSQGIDILSGIQVKFVLGVTGLTQVNEDLFKADFLTQIGSNELAFSADKLKLEVIADATVSLASIQTFLQSYNAVIVGSSAEYTLEN